MAVVKMRSGNYRVPVELEKRQDNRLYFKFGFEPKLKDDVKAMAGAKWHGHDQNPGGPEKVWSVDDNQHNRFQIDWLTHNSKDPTTPRDPYSAYDADLVPMESRRGRPFFIHQKDMFGHVVLRRQCILACEMGTGKTLVAIEAIEYAVEVLQINPGDMLYVAPKNALESVIADFSIWKCPYQRQVRFMTYEQLVELVANWRPGYSAPRCVFYDESSRLKNPTTQRSQAAKYVADCVREEHLFQGKPGMIVLMSGSPAPKAPSDWWHQCEVACPGFLKEGTVEKERRRLALIVQEENMIGCKFPRLITWYDNELKCKVCGQFEKTTLEGKSYIGHDADAAMFGQSNAHTYIKSTNEVSDLYSRMRGLVLVKFKKDCADLPPKTFRRIYVKPKQSTLNAAKLIQAKSKTTIQALTLLRELSDGFQYKDEQHGEVPCKICNASGQIPEYFYIGEDGKDLTVGNAFEQPMEYGENGEHIWIKFKGEMQTRAIACTMCGGTKQVPNFVRESKPVPCPKIDIVKEMLENFDDLGRLVIYCGFEASVDRVNKTCLDMGWQVLQVDKRGWHWFAQQASPEWTPKAPAPPNKQAMLHSFRFEHEKYPQVVVVAQADSAGMGLNLSSALTILLYSVSFNAESYIQCIERNQRPGVEVTLERAKQLGMEDAKIEIVQIVHLPSDEFVYNNLEKKQRLQDQTLGALKAAMDRAVSAEERTF